MIETRYVEDPMTGDLTVIRSADAGPILEANKALASSGDGYSPSRELRRAATVPFIVYELWKNLYGVDMFNPDHGPKVMELLDSSEWAYLRTAPGTLSRKPRRRLILP
jgi:hypothetical protein